MQRIDSRRGGFTLVELLVVIAVIAILIALLLPAIQSAREAGRVANCKNSLHQVGLACIAYHDAYRRFPYGTESKWPMNATTANDTVSRKNWIIRILPFMEESALYDSVNWSNYMALGGLQSWDSAAGQARYNKFTSTPVQILLCPSDSNNAELYRINQNSSIFLPARYQYYARNNYGSNSCLMPNYYYNCA